MLLLVVSFLMIQLHSVKKILLVVSVVPLGLIGVVAALLISGYPLGFVAILGVLALIGIIIRNSVILVTQIDEFIAAGESAWSSVVKATEHRCRPILLSHGHLADVVFSAGAVCGELWDQAANKLIGRHLPGRPART